MRQGTITVDLGYGDSGKGTIVDFLTRELEAAAVVRYNGGPQAGHCVVTPEGDEHIFAQFGSGTFVEGVLSHLGPDVLINPFNAFIENEHLRELGVEDALERLSVDALCAVITPYQIATNHIRELIRGAGRHGSCGQGVGETRYDELEYGPGAVLRAGQLHAETKVKRVLTEIRERKLAEIDAMLSAVDSTAEIESERGIFFDPNVIPSCIETYRSFASAITIGASDLLRHLDKPIIFEASQGVLLDETYGFYPYTTWTDTTTRHAQRIAAELSLPVKTMGIMRAYATRHGPGPFVSESPRLTSLLPDLTNELDRWQLNFRVGYPDLVLLQYALEVAGEIDELAVTCLDRVEKLEDWHICASYGYTGYTSLSSSCFELLDDRNVVGLVPPLIGKGALGHMEAMTRRLLHDFEPILDPLEPTVDAYASLLKEQLQIPLTLISRGRTAVEKERI